MVKSVIFLLLGVAVANAQFLPHRRNAFRVPPAPTTLELDESFNTGSGFDLVWTPVGDGIGVGIFPDDTGTPGTIGAESLRITPAGNYTYIYRAITGADEWWFKVAVTPLNMTTDAYITLSTFSAYNDFAIQIRGSDGRIVAGQKTATQASAGSFFANVGQTAYYWGHGIRGTGANGVMEVWASTVDSRPGSPEVALSNGDGITQPGIASIQVVNGGGSYRFDNFQVSRTGPIP